MPLEDKVEYFGRLYELIFKTSGGSLYYFNRERGLWLRKKFDGTNNGRCVYVGCLDCQDSEAKWLDVLTQTQSGEVREMVSKFIPGRLVLGIYLEKGDRALSREDFVILQNGRIKLRGNLNLNLGIHIGHSISEIYREVDPIREYNAN